MQASATFSTIVNSRMDLGPVDIAFMETFARLEAEQQRANRREQRVWPQNNLPQSTTDGATPSAFAAALRNRGSSIFLASDTETEGLSSRPLHLACRPDISDADIAALFEPRLSVQRSGAPNTVRLSPWLPHLSER